MARNPLRGNRVPPVSLPPRCRWEWVRVGPLRRERVLVCPPEAAGHPSARAPVIYFLHGAGHSPASFFTDLPTEPLLPMAADACLVFVDGGKRWYLDSPLDPRSRGETAFLAALRAVEARHPVGGSRDRRAICGFSMGGFGAMYLAARHPDLFASASSILGPLDIEPLCPDYPGLRALLGDDCATWRKHNPAALADALRDVRLLVTTGDAAWDRPLGKRFVEACRAQGILAQYRQRPGAHDVGFVAAQLEHHLAFHLNPGPAWRIRRAEPDDADALARNCFPASPPDDVARHLEWSLAESARGRRVHLVVDAGEAVASGELSITGDRAEIANLVVEASLQGRGLGTALIRALADEASARDIATLEIGVRSDDSRVRALYEREGFTAYRETTVSLDGQPTRVTYLRKRLPPRASHLGGE